MLKKALFQPSFKLREKTREVEGRVLERRRKRTDRAFRAESVGGEPGKNPVTRPKERSAAVATLLCHLGGGSIATCAAGTEP